MTQYSDEKTKIKAKTTDFGLEMKSDMEFNLIEKMNETKYIWKMKYTKYEKGNELDHSLNLVINPIKVIYEGVFVKSIVDYFKTDTKLQIKEQAEEKWADFKQEAQLQLQETIKQHSKKDINIVIYSPILLLPVNKNDPNSELWCLNLGNFSMKSIDSEDYYERYALEINSVKVKFYE
jgi:hypothetical protein